MSAGRSNPHVIKFFMRLFFYLLLSITLTACKPTTPQSGQQLLEADKKELIFVTHNGPTTYFLNGENQAAGIEYDLATLFVQEYAPEYLSLIHI